MQTRYVNTASTAGGDGTTNGTVGSTRAYASLNEALSAFGTSTLSDAYTINCTGSAADTTSCEQSAWQFTTSATNYVLVQGENRTGVYDTSKYRLEITDTSVIYNNTPAHVRLDALQAQLTVTTTGGDCVVFRLATANNSTSCDHRISNCIAKVVRNGTRNTYSYYNSDTTHGGTCKIWNCSAIGKPYGSLSYGSYVGFGSDGTAWATSNLYHYNCTSYGNEYPYLDVQRCLNCLGANATGGAGAFVSTGTTGHTNNASDDASAGGTSARTNQTFAFKDTSAGDLRLLWSDTGAKGYGAVDPGSGLYSDDIAGHTRGAAWDIGFYEAQAPTAALTGTATSSITETDVVSGGKTVILTLTDDAFVSATQGAWSYRASGSASNGNNAASLSPGLPAGWAVGDLHVMVFSNQGGTNSRTPSKPTGWTSIGGDTGWLNGTASMAVYYRVAVAGDTDPTLSLSGTGATGDTQCSQIHGFYNAAGCVLNVTGSTSTNTSADDVGPVTGITPGSGDLALLIVGKTNDWNGAATLAGWSLAAQNESTTGGDAGNALLYKLSATNAATGDLTVADNGGTASAGVGFGILCSFRGKIFNDIRSNIASGLDSAQSEAAGWDAKVKPNIPVANVVRTSDTVCTVTLQAQADYDITAQETITATIPAVAVTGGAQIVASPTFTVSPTVAASIVESGPIKLYAVRRASYH